MTYLSIPYPPAAVAKGIISLQDNLQRVATFKDQMETLSTALSWPLRVFKSETFCFIQGALIQYFITATALWTAMIATHCLLAVKLRKPMAVAAAENYKWYHLTVWGISLVMTAVPFAVQDYAAKGAIYADAGIWCWIATPYNDYQVALLYGPMWGVFVYTIVAYTYVAFKIVQARKFVLKSSGGAGKASQNSINRFAFKAFLYCCVFLSAWVPGTINRASALLDDNPMHQVYEFYLAQTIVMPLHGFMNSLIFFFFALTGSMGESTNTTSDQKGSTDLHSPRSMSANNKENDNSYELKKVSYR
ncbi:hypothetical protein HK099_006445 [Clydaea vesicula]|uniref:G-protein coupled receptors family 2 profile 2 domain-containing protein n=1 Tax=Clydaea vesicula TaxID=447962 RepID=A0AAD5XWZ1_9FUNG|nr:hypothetical protein HK099_006445 [Clydaea vesicula]